MKAIDLKDKPPHILIYGQVGTFKTGFVSQASNGYLFDFDDGMQIALRYEDEFSELRRQIEFDTYVDTNPSKPDAWLRARKKLESIRQAIQNKTWEYDAIVIDSLTGMGKAIRLHVMSCIGDAFEHPKIQHLGAMITEMERFLTLMRACNILRLVTAHQLSIERVKDGEITPFLDHTTPLSITRPHSDNRLPWLYDEIWYSKTVLGAMGKFKFMLENESVKRGIISDEKRLLLEARKVETEANSNQQDVGAEA